MTAAASTHLVIADDHPLFRDALRQAVSSVVTSARIDEAGSFADLTALRDQLVRKLSGCQGDTIADCRIIEALAPATHRDAGLGRKGEFNRPRDSRVR